MAVVKPFVCIRPDEEVVCDVAALPYDVYDRKEAKEAVKGKPLLFLNIDRPETQFDDDFDMYSDEAYKMAKKLLYDEIRQGIFVRETESCYYLYQLTMDGRMQTGLVACSSIDDYLSGTIKKHENTRQDKEIDRIKHVGVCEAQTGPILLAYRSDKTLKLISAQVKQEPAMYDFITEDGIGHKVWKISDKSIKTDIESCFYNIEATYIADGHHRAASAVKVGLAKREANINYTGKEEFNYFLSVLFPDDELMILPYNRAVKDTGGLTDNEFFDKIKDRFYIKKLEIKNFTPSAKDCFGLYFKSKWYELRIKEQYILDDPVGGLDASILQDNLLAPVLGIKDPRTDKRISFVGGIRGTKELERMVDSGAYALALDMYPTQMSELLAVADAGLLMPPKSTWFEPKLRSGIFIHDIGTGK